MVSCVLVQLLHGAIGLVCKTRYRREQITRIIGQTSLPISASIIYLPTGPIYGEGDPGVESGSECVCVCLCLFVCACLRAGVCACVS